MKAASSSTAPSTTSSTLRTLLCKSSSNNALPGGLFRCMLYIMRRTQLYLDEDLWNALHFHARLHGQTISELVRKAARDKYMGNPEERLAAMKAIVGLWRDRKDS